MARVLDPFKSVGVKAPPTHNLQINLTGLEPDQLLELRARVDSMLPVRSLKDLDLASELVLQVMALQALQTRVMNDAGETPVNQIAQVANSLSAALGNLIKVQSDVYTSERLKTIESLLIEQVKTLPMEAQEAFFDAYEKAL
jgi:uncharacterized protein with PhoU and TrkA domain